MLFISVIQSVKGAQFSNIACSLFLSGDIPALSAPATAAVTFPIASMYASLKCHKIDFNIVALILI